MLIIECLLFIFIIYPLVILWSSVLMSSFLLPPCRPLGALECIAVGQTGLDPVVLVKSCQVLSATNTLKQFCLIIFPVLSDIPNSFL